LLSCISRPPLQQVRLRNANDCVDRRIEQENIADERAAAFIGSGGPRRRIVAGSRREVAS
jgi:hypothetical protein